MRPMLRQMAIDAQTHDGETADGTRATGANSQPWRWVLTDDSVELFADPERFVRGADSTGREALISCGAVLHHFRTAMAAAGWDTAVTRFPTADDPLHLASVQFTAARSVTDEQHARADAILLRHTDRLPGWLLVRRRSLFKS